MRGNPFLARSFAVPRNGIPFQKFMWNRSMRKIGTDLHNSMYLLTINRSLCGTDFDSVPMQERAPFQFRSLRRSSHEM